DAAGLEDALATNPPEEGGEAPVIVLAPAFVGMMMALGAGEPLAEEDLGQIVDELLRRLDLLVPDGRRAAELVAGGRQEGADEGIVGEIRGDRLADPLVEREGAEGAVRLATALDAQDVGPPGGE